MDIENLIFSRKATGFHRWSKLSELNFFTVAFNNIQTPKLKAQPTKCVFWYGQSNVQWLLPDFDYYQALFHCLNSAHKFDYHMLSSSWKLEGAAEHLIFVSKKCICRLSFEF